MSWGGTLRAGGRAALLILGIAAVLVLIAGALLLWVQTTGGRAFIVTQVERLAPHSGLRVRIGRLDGNPLRDWTAHDVVLSDPTGPFLTIRSVAVDWVPFAFTGNRLVLNRVSAPDAHWLRVPKFIPSEEPNQPLLPKFDIHLGQLRVDRLAIDRAVAGRAAAASLSGSADVVRGRAIVRANAATTLGDRLMIDLDSRPDDDQFKLTAAADAPSRGLAASFTGLAQPLTLRVNGAGSWTQWRGRLAADTSGHALARLQLTADDGRFGAHGTIAPGLLTGPGLIQEMTAPGLAVDAFATTSSENRYLSLELRAASPAFTLRASGPIDLQQSRIERIGFSARLLKPELVTTAVRVAPVDLSGSAMGPLSAVHVVANGRTASAVVSGYTLEDVRLTADGLAGKGPLGATLALTAARALGLPPEAQGLGQGLSAAGPVIVDHGVVRADRVALRLGRATATAAVRYELASGRYAAGLNANIPRFPIPGVGIADLYADVRLAPGAGGRGFSAAGPVRARFTRVDDSTLAQLAGGPPVVAGRLVFGGSATRLDALTFAAPRLRLAGSAALGPGTVIAARLGGRSEDYGPIELIAAGTTSQPRLDLALASPGLGVGLVNVRAQVRPAGDGAFHITGNGGSRYGPFVADVGINTQGGLTVDVRTFTLAGVTLRGRIVPVGSVYGGDLKVSGDGLSGNVHLASQGGVQRADIGVNLVKSRLQALDPLLFIGRGHLGATVLVPRSGVEGSVILQLQQLRRGTIEFSRIALRGNYAGGGGQVHAEAAGEANAPFSVVADLGLSPGRVQLAASGDVDGQPIRLAAPAVAVKQGETWRLNPATLLVADGRATISGTNGPSSTQVNADLNAIRLDALSALGALSVRGVASGRASLTVPRHGLPQGSLQLLVRGFSRAQIAVASTPVEIEAAAALRGNAGAARAFVRQNGKVIGAAQAELNPIPGSDANDPTERILSAPVRGIVHISSPAEAIWPLAGVDALDLRGPITVDAHLMGHLGEPQIEGAVAARGARLESASTGTIITNLNMDGRFDGPSLTILNATGRAGDGSLTASGRVSLTDADGLTARINAKLTNALMLRTDQLRAAVSGPASITLDRSGGLIAGDVRIDSGRYNIASAPAEQVPTLKVREIGLKPLNRALVSDGTDTIWSVRLHAVARSRFNVTGLGLDSDWGADVRVTGPITAPLITGRATLARGTYDFSGKTFELSRGEIRFTGEYPPNPSVDIAASAAVSGLTANLTIGGTALKPEIAFTSNPALPEDEVLSRVLFGSSVTDLSAPEALQLAAAVAQLRGGGGGGLNPVNTLRRATGLDRLRFQSADQSQQGRNTIPSASSRSGTSLAAGKYIGRNVYVEVATDARGYSATNIEVSLTRWLKILSSVASQGSNAVAVRVQKDY